MIVTRLSLVLGIGLLFVLGSCWFRGPSADGPAFRSEAAAGPSEDFTARVSGGRNQTQALRTCTVQDLLPLPCQNKSQEWSDEYVVDLPYTCTCAATKGRYFCPSQASPQYPIWKPLAVTEGSCSSISREELVGGPLPPKFKVLVFGNSHLRQTPPGCREIPEYKPTRSGVHYRTASDSDADVAERDALLQADQWQMTNAIQQAGYHTTMFAPISVKNGYMGGFRETKNGTKAPIYQAVEAMVCMFPGAIDSKRVSVGTPGVNTIVPADTQCRACTAGSDKKGLRALQSSLLDHQCMAEGGACRCHDDTSEYFFENGAILHYMYSSAYQEKTLLNARSKHDMDPLSSYDAVILNAGNGHSNATDTALKAAGEVQAAGAPFFWLSTYDGIGRISDWTTYQKKSFFASGAKYVDIESMARGMDAWTKSAAEGVKDDEHFCLPGPPNEMSLLLVKILWAVYEEKNAS